MSYAELGRLVEEQLPTEDFAVLGESFSGPIAIEIARTHDRATALILAASFTRAPLGRRSFAPLSLFNHKLVPSELTAWALLGRYGARELKDRLRRTLSSLPPKTVRYRIREALGVDASKSLGEVRCPVMYLRGRADRLVGLRATRDVSLSCPECRVVEIDAPHMVLETQPKAAADCVVKFCEEAQRRSRAVRMS